MVIPQKLTSYEFEILATDGLEGAGRVNMSPHNIRDLVGGAGIDEKTISTFLNQFYLSPTSGRDDRNAGCHRLQQYHAQSFPGPGRQNK